MLYVFTAQRCGPFEVVENSHLLAFNNSLGGQATIRCNRSFRFSDGTQTKSFRCLPTLSWEPSEQCQCKNISLDFTLSQL